MGRKNSRNWSKAPVGKRFFPGKQPKSLLADIIAWRCKERVGGCAQVKVGDEIVKWQNEDGTEITRIYPIVEYHEAKASNTRTGVAYRKGKRRQLKRLTDRLFWRELDQQTIQAEVDQQEREYMARQAEQDRLDEVYAMPHVKEYLAYKNDHATEQQIAQYRRVSCRQAPRQPIVIEDELFAAHEPEQIILDTNGLTLASHLAKSGSTYGTARAAA